MHEYHDFGFAEREKGTEIDFFFIGGTQLENDDVPLQKGFFSFLLLVGLGLSHQVRCTHARTHTHAVLFFSTT